MVHSSLVGHSSRTGEGGREGDVSRGDAAFYFEDRIRKHARLGRPEAAV